MDIYGNDLGKIAEAIPRIRGYNLMKYEESLSQREINRTKKEQEVWVAKLLCRSIPFWDLNSSTFEFSRYADIKEKYFLIQDEKGCDIDIRWDRIHGWKRKILKFGIKKQNEAIQKQFDVWNKYVGKEDVMYIRSRMGGDNWKYYEHKEDITNQPWFLDRADDWFDSTYCDFYVKIDSNLTCAKY